MQKSATRCARVIAFFVIFSVLLLVYGCGSSGSTMNSAVIGAEGGTVTSGDGRLTLTIPPGALSAATTITVTSVSVDNLPAGWADVFEVSRIYLLEPEGIQFAVPITASLAVSGSAEDLPARFAITSSDGLLELPGVQSLGMDITTGQATLNAQLRHFSLVWDNLPRDGGVTVRFSGIPSAAPVGERVFEAQAFVTSTENSQFRSDAVIFDDNNSTLPIDDEDNIGFGGNNAEDMGVLDVGRAKTLMGDILYDCESTGVGEYRGKVSFTRYNLGAVFASAGFVTLFDTSDPGKVFSTDYTSTASRQVVCGSPVPEPSVDPTPEETVEPTPEETAEPTADPTAEETPEETAEPTPEETAEPVCDDSEKICQNTGEAPGCISNCKCDDGFPIGSCEAVCLDTGSTPTQCDSAGIGCPGGASLVCPG